MPFDLLGAKHLVDKAPLSTSGAGMTQWPIEGFAMTLALFQALIRGRGERHTDSRSGNCTFCMYDEFQMHQVSRVRRTSQYYQRMALDKLRN